MFRTVFICLLIFLFFIPEGLIPKGFYSQRSFFDKQVYGIPLYEMVFIPKGRYPDFSFIAKSLIPKFCFYFGSNYSEGFFFFFRTGSILKGHYSEKQISRNFVQNITLRNKYLSEEKPFGTMTRRNIDPHPMKASDNTPRVVSFCDSKVVVQMKTDYCQTNEIRLTFSSSLIWV